LQILLYLRSLYFDLAFAIDLLCSYLHAINCIYIAAVKIGILNVIEFASYQYLHLV